MLELKPLIDGTWLNVEDEDTETEVVFVAYTESEEFEVLVWLILINAVGLKDPLFVFVCEPLIDVVCEYDDVPEAHSLLLLVCESVAFGENDVDVEIDGLAVIEVDKEDVSLLEIEADTLYEGSVVRDSIAETLTVLYIDWDTVVDEEREGDALDVWLAATVIEERTDPLSESVKNELWEGSGEFETVNVRCAEFVFDCDWIEVGETVCAAVIDGVIDSLDDTDGDEVKDCTNESDKIGDTVTALDTVAAMDILTKDVLVPVIVTDSIGEDDEVVECESLSVCVNVCIGLVETVSEIPAVVVINKTVSDGSMVVVCPIVKLFKEDRVEICVFDTGGDVDTAAERQDEIVPAGEIDDDRDFSDVTERDTVATWERDDLAEFVGYETNGEAEPEGDGEFFWEIVLDIETLGELVELQVGGVPCPAGQ